MLKQLAVSATLWSAIEQIGSKGLSTIFMLVFARFLTPEDFGAFSAAALVIGFGSTIGMFGLNSVLVQRDHLDPYALSTAFWLCLGSTFVIACTLCTLAVPIAGLFGNLSIAPLILGLTLAMVLSASSAMVTALLRRELNMKALARRTLLAGAISGAIATPLIVSGFGAWGLVAQMVSGAAITLVLTIRLIGWPILWAFDRQVAQDMLRFGAPVAGADLVALYDRESPKLFVGLFLGIEALGIFAMAMRVMNLLLQVLGLTLTRVTLPILSQVNRSNPARIAEIYVRLVRLAAGIILPIFMLVIVLRAPLIELLLGPSWEEIVPVVLFLCGAGLITVFSNINQTTLVALSYPQGRFLFSLLRAIIGSLLLLILTPFGTVATAAAVLLRGTISEPFQLLYLLRRLSMSFRSYVTRFKWLALASSVLLVVCSALLMLLKGEAPAVVLVFCGLGALVAYTITLIILDKAVIAELVEVRKLRIRL